MVTKVHIFLRSRNSRTIFFDKSSPPVDDAISFRVNVRLWAHGIRFCCGAVTRTGHPLTRSLLVPEGTLGLTHSAMGIITGAGRRSVWTAARRIGVSDCV